MTKICLELELLTYGDIPIEEVEKDIRWGEDQIGWNFDYKITSLKATKENE